MSRCIGMAHRVKVISKKGEPAVAKPTKVCIRENGESVSYELATETDELDFLLGRFPVRYGKITEFQDITGTAPHQIRWRKAKDGEDLSPLHESHVKMVKEDGKKGKTAFVATEIPYEFEGLREGDWLGLVLSGSGNRLAYAASRRAEVIGAMAFHLPGFKLRDARPEEFKDNSDFDHEILARMLLSAPGEFYLLEPRDRDLVAMREAYISRIQAMKARMGTDQRLRAHFMGRIFCDPGGCYPEGEIELAYESARANDAIYQAVVTEEKRRDRELKLATEKLEVYQRLFAPIEGAGVSISSRIIASIGDIRQFKKDSQMKAFCGVHVLKDGRFPRRRNNERANWKPDCRQALYLLGEQFNRRPDSVWGKKLREYKEKLRAKHPNPVLIVRFKDADKDDETKVRFAELLSDTSEHPNPVLVARFKDAFKGNETKVRFVELLPGMFEYNKKTGAYSVMNSDGDIEKLKGTLKYTPAHIHKMALWRTLTKFVEWLHREWWALEKAHLAGTDAQDMAANG